MRINILYNNKNKRDKEIRDNIRYQWWLGTASSEPFRSRTVNEAYSSTLVSCLSQSHHFFTLSFSFTALYTLSSELTLANDISDSVLKQDTRLSGYVIEKLYIKIQVKFL
jgi:hypothetical protein